jgi:ADP-heptose:LPS heptosyltransferase
MKEILIINLTRMGDLLQTTPLMAGLKEEHPGLRITLLVNSAFSEICRGIPFIDELIEFDMKDYQKRLLEKKHSLVENYNFIEGLISRINSREYDLTINVTHSAISAILASFIRTKEIRGFSIDSEGHRVIKHPWMRYFFNVIPNRIYNPFHLVDMYLKIGGVKPKIKGLIYNYSGEAEERASLLLEHEGIKEGDMLVGFHLGASKSDKTWPASSYAELAGMIADAFGAKIVLFGSSGEADLAGQFEMVSHVRPVNFVGKTNIGELAALLRRCRLFISNDTGPLHIATSVGTQVIDISTANVHFMETGPYGEGHYVVQADLPCAPCGFDVKCMDMVCKSFIRPSAVFEVVKEALDGEMNAFINDSQAWNNLQVYKSHFTDDGYLGFTPLIRQPINRETFYRILYRQLWNTESSPMNGDADMIYDRICKEMSHYSQFDHLLETVFSIRKEIDALTELANLSEEGFNFISLIAEESAKDYLDVRKIKEIWEKVGPVEKGIELIGHANPSFRPLTLLFMYAKEALEGNDLKIISEASRAIYADLMNRSKNMLQLMITAIQLQETGPEGKGRELTYNKQQ